MSYDFTIPLRTPTFNELLRMHFRARARSLQRISWEIRSQAMPPPKPWPRAKVTIHRYTTGQLDEDGKGGIAKGILDSLQPCSTRHPAGLGFIAGDGPDQLELVVLTVKSHAHATRIIIEQLP